MPLTKTPNPESSAPNCKPSPSIEPEGSKPSPASLRSDIGDPCPARVVGFSFFRQGCGGELPVGFLLSLSLSQFSFNHLAKHITSTLEHVMLPYAQALSRCLHWHDKHDANAA